MSSLRARPSQKLYSQKRYMGLLLLSCLLAGQLEAFVLNSGAKHAILKGVSPSNPNLVIYWDGSSPDLEDVDSLGNGMWASLSDEDVTERIIALAFSIWNKVPGSYLRLKLAKRDDAVANSNDEQHTIVVENSDNVSASAYALPIVKDQAISDCDIVLTNRSISAMNLAYTILHEIGHCLGLGHAHSNYGAVMGYARSSRSLELGSDDMAGLIYLYPDPAYDQQHADMANCATSPFLPPSQGPNIWFVMLILPLLLALTLRRPLRSRQKAASLLV